MKSGADIDIITGLPKAKAEQDREAEQQEKMTRQLKAQSDFHGVAASPAGQQLIALVEQKLVKRIDDLISGDPQATAYQTILRDIGAKTIIADKAVAQLTARIKKE